MAAVGIRRTVQRRNGRGEAAFGFCCVRNAGRCFCRSAILRSIVGQLHPVSCPFLRQQKAISSSQLTLLS